MTPTDPAPSTADVDTQAVVYARNRMGHRNYGDPDHDRYVAYIDGYMAGHAAGARKDNQ
jgi:hypothetical protein